MFVRQTRERLGVPLETHFHMDFGLGVANTLLAVAEGVEVVQTTVTGIGERAGNTPMEDTVLALLTMYGVESGIISTWVRNVGEEHLTEAFPFRPELVGQHPPKLVLGKGSGLDSVAAWLERLGRTASREQIAEILDEVKERSLAEKGLLDDERFLAIVDRVVG